LVSYLRYIGKMFWPSNLAALYPYHHSWPVWYILISACVIFGFSLAVLCLARKEPFLPVGWFWFLGTLVPVIGIVQVGEQSIADRYTYFPMVGLLIALVWGVSGVVQQHRWVKMSLTVVCVAVLVALSVCAKNQIRYWRTSMDLLTHTLTVAGGSALIHNNLGALLENQNDIAGAKLHFIEALRLEPSYDRARYNLARMLAAEGKSDDAASEIKGMSRAWELESHQTLAKIFLQQSKTNETIAQWAAAVPLDPTNASLRESLGLHLAQQGKTAEASEQFAALVQLRPDAEAHYYLALSLVAQGKTREAAEHYQNAIRLKPDWPEPLNDLAWIFATDPHPDLRNGPEAVRLAERACNLSNRGEARFLGTLDAAYAEAGRFQDAITQCDQTIKLAVSTGQQEIGELAAKRLELYRAGRPFHQP
jgi:tetratricopeptide (TPR) repeat protein